MISIKFLLHSFISKEGKSSLMCRVHCDGLYELKAAIHEKIKPKDWNHKKQQVKASEKFYIEINERLQRIETRIAKDFREKLDNGEQLTIKDLQDIISPAAAKAKAPKEPPVRAVYEAWSAHYLEEINLGNKTDKLKGVNYTRKFIQAVSKLEEYKPGLTLSQITPEFLKGYRKFCVSYVKADGTPAPLQDGTIESHYKSIRALLAFAGLPNTHVKAPKTENKPATFALYWEEIKKLLETDYSTKNIKEAALIFVMNCQVCLRVSDLYNLNAGLTEIKTFKHGKVKAFNLTQGKTNNPVFLPFPPMAAKIMERFNWELPMPKNDATFNSRLKAAAKEAGLNRKVRVTKSYNNNLEESWGVIHEKISSHCTRHSGYSLVRQATGNKDLAEAQLGHSNAGVYDHTDPVTVVDSLLAAWEIIDA